MRVRLLSLLPAVAAVAFLGLARADDTAKDDKKPETKKDEAKKDSCDEGCCGAPAKSTVSAKQMECADCTKQDGPCAKCETAVKTGAVTVLPIKGMACGACATKVAAKLDAIDQVAKFLVSDKKGIAVVLVAPGKALKLSEVSKALSDLPFTVDEEAALHGRVSFTIACGESDECPCCGADKSDAKADAKAKEACSPEMAQACSKSIIESVSKLAGVEKVSECTCEKTKNKFYTIDLAKDSKVSIKQLRDTLAASTKARFADLVMFGAKEEAAARDTKKSSS